MNPALPYWQTAAAGFKKAAAQYKVTARVVGPDGHDPQAELAELHKAIAAKPAGILISVADAAVLQPGIDAAVDCRNSGDYDGLRCRRTAAGCTSSEPTTWRPDAWAASG